MTMTSNNTPVVPPQEGLPKCSKCGTILDSNRKCSKCGIVHAKIAPASQTIEIPEGVVPEMWAEDYVEAHLGLSRRTEGDEEDAPHCDFADGKFTLDGEVVASISGNTLTWHRTDTLGKYNTEHDENGRFAHTASSNAGAASRKAEKDNTSESHRDAATAHQQAAEAHAHAAKQEKGAGPDAVARIHQHYAAADYHRSRERYHNEEASGLPGGKEAGDDAHPGDPKLMN